MTVEYCICVELSHLKKFAVKGVEFYRLGISFKCRSHVCVCVFIVAMLDWTYSMLRQCKSSKRLNNKDSQCTRYQAHETRERRRQGTCVFGVCYVVRNKWKIVVVCGVIDANEIVTNHPPPHLAASVSTTLTHNTSDESQITLNIRIEPVLEQSTKLY